MNNSPDLVLGDDGLLRPKWVVNDPVMRDYYDTEWGVPVRDEQGLFERVALEGFQAGLSWSTILHKRPAFRTAFKNFDPDRVAQFTHADIERLMLNPHIIRNRAKIIATVNNARATVALRQEGGLETLIWSFQPERTPVPHTAAEVPTQSAESVALAKALKKAGFTFVGPTTMYALMEAIGMVDTHLVGSHRRGCSGLWNSSGGRKAR